MRFLYFLLLLSAASIVKAQTIEDLFAPKMPSQVDTLYYPFYNGVQMIEVDHIGFWDKKIFFLEQSEPRAMPHSMFHPQPIGNEFYFRNDQGEIIKSYNSPYSLEELNKQFKRRSIQHSSTGFYGLVGITHATGSSSFGGVWAYSPQSSFNFRGCYKVSNQKDVHLSEGIRVAGGASNTRFGLIDSLGEIKIPIEFQDIYPLNDLLIVKKNNKWGIIDQDLKSVVPIKYDEFDNYYSDPKYNKLLYFQDGGITVAIYNVLTRKLNRLKGYNTIYDHYLNQGYLLVMSENNKYGLINLEGKEVLEPIYDRVNNVNQEECEFKNCASVILNGRTFNVDLGD